MIEASGDLGSWVGVTTNAPLNGRIEYVDLETKATSARYYRAVSKP